MKAWQKKHGLRADGIWGNMSSGHAADCDCSESSKPAPSNTKAEKDDDSPKYPGTPLRNGSRNDSVNHVQAKVGATVDGWYGRKTTQAVRKYQANNKLYNDGIVGPKTWKHMFG